MQYAESILKYTITTFLSIFLLSNIFVSIIEADFKGVLALRNIFLMVYIWAVVSNHKIAIGVLTVYNLLFWYHFFTEKHSNLSSWPFNNPILYISSGLERLIDIWTGNQYLWIFKLSCYVSIGVLALLARKIYKMIMIKQNIDYYSPTNTKAPQ